MWWTPVREPVPAVLGLLDEVERGRWQRYRMPADQQRFALGVAITRTVLGPLLGVEPGAVPLDRACAHCAGDHGPPRLRTGGWEISVAHSGDVVAVAFAEQPIGIDVELVDPDPERHAGTATLTLAPVELERWLELPRERRADAFYTAWARKEAVLKASRDGLTLPLAGLTLDPTETRVAGWTSRPELVERLWLTDLDHWPGYAAALATLDQPAPDLDVRVWSFSG